MRTNQIYLRFFETDDEKGEEIAGTSIFVTVEDMFYSSNPIDDRGYDLDNDGNCYMKDENGEIVEIQHCDTTP